jgi:hypothetical protein
LASSAAQIHGLPFTTDSPRAPRSGLYLGSRETREVESFGRNGTDPRHVAG